MKRYYNYFTMLILLMLANATAYSQGVLIFELSDTINAPLVGKSVIIKGKVGDKDTAITYMTDSNGRVVDVNCPAGSYSYEIDYGDYNKGTVIVTDAEYTWVDLDFRNVNIKSTESDGRTPRVDKRVYISLVQGNDYIKVSEKKTDKNGVVTFIVPKGIYRYTANGNNSENFTVDDKNINKTDKARSGRVTHKVFFHFIKEDSTAYELFAKQVSIYDSLGNIVGEAGVCKDGDKEVKMDGEYFNVSETKNPISANENFTYSYKIATRDFGTLTGKFSFGEEDDVNNSIVYVMITEEMIKNVGKNGKGDDKDNDDDEEEEEREDDSCYQPNPTNIRVNVLSARDSITPLDSIPIKVSWLGSVCYGVYKPWIKTGPEGYIFYVSGDSLNFLTIANDHLTFYSNRDTVVNYYMERPSKADVYFRFFVGKEQFNPESVNRITIYKENIEYATLYPKREIDGTDTTYVFDKPVTLIEGDYIFDYEIKEKNYEQRVHKRLVVSPTDTVIYVDKILEKSYWVDIYVTDYDKNVAPNIFIHEKSANGTKTILTDSLGHLHKCYFTGDYTFSAFGTEYKIDSLSNDTTLYFQMKGKSQITKFQFLHDGKLVYPEITHLDIYKMPDDELYARSISTYYPDGGRKWVFEDTVKLEQNKYRLKYHLDDYELNGNFYEDFVINEPYRPDTTIFIVIPVKRNVTITVLDVNGLTISNMFGRIYKYDSDGVLNLSLDYDNQNHSIKSSADGIVLDRLLPGRYQLQLNDIRRDFVVSDYDVNFAVQSGLDLYNVNYVVMTEATKTPLEHLRFDIKKDNATFGTFFTDSKGTAYTLCEEGNYAYALNYASKSGSISVTEDTTITILVPEPKQVTDISIDACPCLNFGDTLKLSALVAPTDATLKDVEWSISNPGVARIYADGTLLANDFGYEDYATVTATAIDSSNVKGNIIIYVGGKCGQSEIKFNIGNGEMNEFAIGSDSIQLNAEPNDGFSRFYIFQSSSDSVKWTNVAGPTTELSAKISSAPFLSGKNFFRVVSATAASETVTLAEGGNVACETAVKSNVVKTFSFNIQKLPWTEVVCENNGASTFRIDASKATDLPEGTTFEWYKKAATDSSFSFIDGSKGKDSISLDIKEETNVKVAITANGKELQTISGTVKVDRIAKFDIAASQDTLCEGSNVTLSVSAKEGSIGNVVWNNDSTGSTITTVARDGSYIATVASALGVCPVATDSIALTIDHPSQISIEASQNAICSEAIVPMTLTIANADKFAWADGSKDRSKSVSPKETTTYSATAESEYGKCPSVSAEKTIYVSGPVSISLDVSETDICQNGEDSVTISVHVVSGESEEFLWWDGLRTSDSVRVIAPTQTTTVWAVASNNVCGASTYDSIEISVATPAEVTFSTPDSIFEYGRPINFNVSTTAAVVGPYKWISIDKDGNETEFSNTSDSTFAYLPSADADYYVEIANGACQTIRSQQISTKLVDNILIPTVFTPHELNGENDDFMPGYSVVIYDRYGNVICDSDKGWDGKYKDKTADAGVYIYVLTLKDGRVKKGTIEVYRK